MQAWLARIRDRLARRQRGPADDAGTPRIKSRPIMDRALKEIFVPELRAHGFTGSFPHFRRIKADRIDLVSFQYPRRGGQFVVELSQCGPAGIKFEGEEPILPDKVTVHDTSASDRYRLRAKAGWRGELMGWRGQLFVFDRPSYDPPIVNTEAAMEELCAKVARTALDAFTREAEQWWEKKAAARG